MPAGAIALAGVIGGGDSAISEKTTRVVLESANFQASSIRKTSSAIKLRTDASMRFEKAQDPVNTVRGLARAVELLREISPGIRLVGGVADQKRDDRRRRRRSSCRSTGWSASWAAQIDAGRGARAFWSAWHSASPSRRRGVFSVTVPSLARDQGRLDQGRPGGRGRAAWSATIPSRRRRRWCPPPCRPAIRSAASSTRCAIFSWTRASPKSTTTRFLSEEAVRAFGFDPAAHVRVPNPIASDQALMRTSLLPGIWKNVTENAKHRESFRLFEIGREIHRRGRGSAGRNSAPGGGALRPAAMAAGLFELKRVAECLMPGAQTVPVEARAYEHPARAAEIQWKGAVAGRLFELHPRFVETGRAAILDLDLRLVESLSGGRAKYTPIRRYPSSAFDLSVIAPLREHAGKLEAAIAGFAGPLLESIQFVRQYAGPPLAEGTKSVSFRVTVGSPERTLSSEEIAAIRATIIEGMRELGYELRV